MACQSCFAHARAFCFAQAADASENRGDNRKSEATAVEKGAPGKAAGAGGGGRSTRRSSTLIPDDTPLRSIVEPEGAKRKLYNPKKTRPAFLVTIADIPM